MNNLTAKFKQVIGFVQKQGNKNYLVGSIVLLAFIFMACTFSMTTSYAVVIDGKDMGQISSSSVLQQAMAAAKERAQQKSGLEITGPYNTVATETKHGIFSSGMSEKELAALLDEQVEWLAPGAVLNINNGELQFAVASEAEGQKVLDRLKEEATANLGDAVIKSVEFAEDVRVETGNVKVSELTTADAIIKQVKAGKEAVKTHIVKEGESFWMIASNNDLSVNELQKLNADIVPELLQIGQEVQLTKIEPLLSVVVTKEVTVEETIAHKTEYKDTAKLLKGESKVVTKGADGKKKVTYEIKEANGSTLEKVALSEVVISEPVTEVVNKGTGTLKISSRSSSSSYNGGNGVLSWPKSGKISSPYGTRSRGFHSGIDITAKTGDAIYAAAGGKVVLASWYYGYGNCIVIDHGNGMKTRYAHLSGYNCSVGQSVSRGQLIGRAGNTGNSTGPHLHFEVIINGSTRNPVNYLQ